MICPKQAFELMPETDFPDALDEGNTRATRPA